MWARLSHFAGARCAEGVHGFQGTYDTIRLVISSHLSSRVDNSNHHCQATWCSVVLLHGTAWATSTPSVWELERGGTGDGAESGSRGRGRGQEAEGHIGEAGVRSVLPGDGRWAVQLQGAPRAASTRGRMQLPWVMRLAPSVPPMLPKLLSSAAMRLFPRGTWRLQLARPPSRNTRDCSWQCSPLCQRVVLCKPVPQPPACHPAWHPWKQIHCLKDGDGGHSLLRIQHLQQPSKPQNNPALEALVSNSQGVGSHCRAWLWACRPVPQLPQFSQPRVQTRPREPAP